MCIIHWDFVSEYDFMLSAWGEGTLDETALVGSSLENLFDEFRKKYRRSPRDISLFVEDSLSCGLDYGITAIDTAFLEKLETLKELILPDSVTSVFVTPKLAEILKRNNTLIRGNFDSFAERFAAENGLPFRPSDFVFAHFYNERYHESTRLTMQFKRDGSVIVEESVHSPGISAGSDLGGELYYPLKKDFYKNHTVKEIAAEFNGSLYDAIVKNGKLAKFLQKAKTHKIFMGNNV